MIRYMVALCSVLPLVGAGTAQAASPVLRGDYVEARNADVFTGPCFSNAEIFIYGDQAVMAWKVTEGRYKGVDLSGLSVAAALKGTTTFSVDTPDLAKSVMIVDQKASPTQREALIAMAKELAAGRLDNVVEVKVSPINLTIERHDESAMSKSAHQAHDMPKAPMAAFWAPGIAEILTRPLCEDDHSCGNEVVAYPPLSRGVEALPAYTLGHSFKGKGLNARWNDPNCRSSFVGHFSL